MIPFLVTITGVTKEGQGAWVLAVDPVGERILTALQDDNSLRWYPMADCKFVRLINPEAPLPVIAVQPAPESKIVMPDLKTWGGNHGG